MRHFFRAIIIFGTIAFSTKSFAQLANDDCSGAQDLGTLATPAGCSGNGNGQGSPSSYNLTNVGSISESPYSTIVNCGGTGTNMSSPASDVWYSFVCTGNNVDVTITGGLNTPNVGLYEGNCGTLNPRGCAVGSGGSLTTNFDQLVVGTTYYLQISGGDINDQGNFTLTLQNNVGCSDCLVEATLDVTPSPVNGTYQPGQTVNFCYTITDWQQTSTNWLQGIEILPGAAWASISPVSPPVDCDGSGGTWGWFNSITSSYTGATYGNGFYFDRDNDGDPGNNFGDDCQGSGLNWTFCWSATVGACPPGSNGDDLSMQINSLADGEAGSWSSFACQNDAIYNFSAALACCEPPIMTGTAETCQGNADGTATATGQGTGPWSYVWTDGSGNTVQTQNNLNGASSISNLAPGTYIVSVTDFNNCQQTGTYTVIAGPVCATCLITNMTSNTSACDPTTNTYTTSGVVEFTTPPTTGTLTVTDCNGVNQVFNAPFTSPINYNLTGQTADGAACSVTAAFSADATCTQTISYTAPICPCNLNYFDATIGACDPNTNSYQVTGNIQFTSAPATGTLTVQVDNGTMVYDTVINPPFVSPYAWSISGLNSDGSNLTISVAFSADPTCSQTLTSTAPASCACSAVAGTYTAGTTGNGLNNYVLCYGDQININSNGDYTLPQDFSVPGATYDTTIAYLAYSCPPSVLPPNDINSDPCLLSVVSFGSNFSDVNTSGAPPNYGGTYTNNTIYYVPITFYSQVDGVYAISINGGNWCYDMGTPFAVQYLPQITTTNTVTCTDVTVTINGGLPAVDGSNFTLSNLMPATASLSTTSVANGGTVTISGLQNGDSYSFDITDGNGCPITFSGGPFVGMPVANAGPDGQSCTLSYTLAAVPSVGTGAWTGLSGGTFSPSSSATATVTVPGAGSYSFVWTETNGSCIDKDTVVVQFSNLSYTENVTQSTCGNADGGITLTAANGITPYTYSIDGGTTTQSSGSFTGLLAGTYNDVVQDALGCQVTGTSTVTDQGGPTINGVTPVEVTCNAACDGSIAVNATGATQFSIDGGTTYQGTNSFTGLCAGFYNISVQNAIGCIVTDTITITEPPVLTYSAATTDLLCNNVCTGVVAVTSSGGTGTLQYSSDNGTSFQPSSTFNNLCAGTYNMLVQDANGCQITGTETINEPPALTLTLGVQDASCFGVCDGTINSIPAGGTSPYSYAWGPSGTGGNVPLVSNLCTGTYTLSVQDQNGCTIDTTISVSGPQAVTINNINTTDVQCFGDCNGTATITATNASQYSIDGVNYVPTNNFTGLCSGNYVAYAQDTSGCEITQPFTIEAPPQVTLTVAGDTTICIGGTASLTSQASGGVGGFTYSWDNGGGNTQNTNVSPTTPQIYCATAADANGCMSPTLCVSVSQFQPLTVNAFSSIGICPGSSANISAIASGGDGGPYNYSWDQGVGAGAAQTVTPSVTTQYTVTVTDGCETPSDTASVVITVYTLPNISFTGGDSACTSVTTTFTPTGVPVGSTGCIWNFSDGTTVHGCGAVTPPTFTEVGCWDGTLSIITPDGCPVQTPPQPAVCVYDNPNSFFTFEPQPTTVMNSTMNFTNMSSANSVNYTWYFDTYGANDSLSTTNNPSYTFPSDAPGSYEVCLMALTANQCPAVYCDTVIIGPEFLLYVPNAFTPDGDGINESFYPVVQGIDENSFVFYVFDRWGELIFESHHPSIWWDGTYKGQDCLEDVYVWKLKVKDKTFGKMHDYIGHVSLLR